MINLDNFSMCQIDRPNDKPSCGFGALLPTPSFNNNDNYETTTQSDFGKGVKSTKTEMRRIQAGMVPPGGGLASTRPDRGMAASGACGEIFKTDLDPQRSTVAQRSWTYSADLMVAVKTGLMKSAP